MGPSRDQRAKAAKAFLNKKLPAVLRSNSRARRGVESAQLIVNPPREPLRTLAAATSLELANQPDHVRLVLPASQGPPGRSLPSSIRIWPVDTLEAAHRLSKLAPSRVAILNMASPLRPGGGVLTGATSQEEWLCSRTTLYPSLLDEFYRLPEVSAVYTPDVLVCKTWDEDPLALTPVNQFFIDVVTAAMLRLPDTETNQQGELVYSEQKDRDMVLAKMRCVMRILRAKHIHRVVLGAWGCGAYGNPVEEIASAWKRVLLGPPARRTHGAEVYDDLDIVFAINDEAMSRRFATAFGPGAVFEDGGGAGDEA
ncbi:hypothetical protein M419DRAFT_85547 [Trichoderma reesei RUT C-30]|uniref:Microbial-type PARG catalytic domain-containing protein n=1 Tax=Hypocrea jecorina (strain ATCC 56765 / BCRC 32924 / NRRL 11460 / Rut C-30) TaxID=1344414 RepID=A0A024S3U3_HYPJR|nr:hypothetical protein M419DRAFT_85547 [Trichoderma reesei RUT C-30]